MPAGPAAIAEMSVRELAAQRAASTPPVVIDVREGVELDICALEGAVHLPMDRVPERLDEIPRDTPLVVLCHHGIRSRMVAEFLARAGFTDVANLAGGIDAWAVEIDPAMPRY